MLNKIKPFAVVTPKNIGIVFPERNFDSRLKLGFYFYIFDCFPLGCLHTKKKIQSSFQVSDDQDFFLLL